MKDHLVISNNTLMLIVSQNVRNTITNCLYIRTTPTNFALTSLHSSNIPFEGEGELCQKGNDPCTI